MKKTLIGFYILIIIGIIFVLIIVIFSIVSIPNLSSAGEKIYNKNCLVCHGETGKGEGSKAGTAINNQNFLSSCHG